MFLYKAQEQDQSLLNAPMLTDDREFTLGQLHLLGFGGHVHLILGTYVNMCCTSSTDSIVRYQASRYVVEPSHGNLPLQDMERTISGAEIICNTGHQSTSTS